MLSVLLDTGLFAIPPYAADEDAVHAIILRLVHWNAAVGGDSPVRLFRLSDVEERLALCGCWPIEPDLEALFELFGLQGVYSVNDVLNVYVSLLGKSANWQQLGIEAYTCDVAVDPDPLVGHAPAFVVEHSRLVYANRCLGAQFHTGSLSHVASGLPHIGSMSVYLSGSADQLTGELSNQVQTPVPLSDHVLLLDRLEDLADAATPLALWNLAQHSKDLYLAMLLKCVAISRGSGEPIGVKDVPRFAIGSVFLDSLATVQAGPGENRASVVLEACCRVILRIPKYQLAPMGKRSQLTREQDRATAWRTHVTKGHEAIRLMIWQYGDTLELANVGPKHELKIEDGLAAEAYRYTW